VVAVNERELPALDELERRGTGNGLAGMRRLGPGELREHEPEVAGVAGLVVPETGIVDYGRVALAYVDAIRENGGEIRTGARLTGVRPDGANLVCETTAGAVEARVLVNCAGLHSDRVARLCGAEPGVAIVPFRGEYHELRPDRAHLVRNLLYPVPDPELPFLGVHFTRRIDGRVECGPNAVLALAREGYTWRAVSPRDLVELARFPGAWRMMRRMWRAGVGEMHRSLSRRAFVRALRRLLPALRDDDLVAGGAGVRAQAVAPDGRLLDDFHVVEAPRTIHVLNAPSPAATASIAIGAHVAALVARRLESRGA
jgi:L-2-hydroxyglutarate oxidase